VCWSEEKEKRRKRHNAAVALRLSSPTKMKLLERVRANGGGVVPRRGGVGVAIEGWSKEKVGKRA